MICAFAWFVDSYGNSLRSLRGPESGEAKVVGVTELEHIAKSSGKSQSPSSGAAESAAVDPNLALIIQGWSRLTAPAKAKVMGIVRASMRTD
jgi:hypothetical protein